MSKTFPSIIAIAAGLGAMGVAVFSSAGAQDRSVIAGVEADTLKTAIFAGGCFWCVEADFDKVDGVIETVSGYTGGSVDNPTYKQVSRGGTGHYEAVEVTYDPSKVSYETLVDYFLRHVDPFDAMGQFCDKGESYRTAIFATTDEERAIAEEEISEGEAELGAEFATPVLATSTFWPAEEYHQDYYKKSSLKYKYYRHACGRDARVKEVWGADGH